VLVLAAAAAVLVMVVSGILGLEEQVRVSYLQSRYQFVHKEFADTRRVLDYKPEDRSPGGPAAAVIAVAVTPPSPYHQRPAPT
jgi:hypothetical protein